MYSILLIDDEKKITEGLKAIIHWEKLRCKVIDTAYNGKKGLEKALQMKPDIVITDIRMPYVDGLHMIRQIKEINQKIKFILLSGYSDFEYAQQGMQLGIKNYVLKPVEESELERCIAQVIADIEQERLLEQRLLPLREHLLHDLVHKGESMPDLLQHFKKLNIEITAHSILGAVIKFQKYGDLTEQKKKKVFEIISEIHPPGEVYPFQYSNMEIGVLLVPPNHAK